MQRLAERGNPALAALALLFSLMGCSKSAPAAVDVSILNPGDYCRVDFRTSPSRSGETACFGAVVEVTADEVVLDDAWLSARSESTTPSWLRRVPYLNRLYKNVGIARQEVGTVRLAIDQIISIRIEDAPPADDAALERVGIDFE